MTIAQNSVITYNDLITKTVDYIVSKTSNINGTSSLVTGYLNNSHPSDWNNKEISTNPKTKVTFTVKDSIVQTVTRQTIAEELENFLKGRNLYTLTDVEISHKSLINYVSNVSAFVCAKLVHVVNQFSTKTDGYLIYVPTNPAPIGISDVKNIELTKSEIQNNLSTIVNVMSLNENAHTMNMNVAYNCSSSSSSCSSSSCSSSSSLFIAYMVL